MFALSSHHLLIASWDSLPCTPSRERIGISVYSFASDKIIATFVFSELTEVQCYWGKNKLRSSNLHVLILFQKLWLPIGPMILASCILPRTYIIQHFLSVLLISDPSTPVPPTQLPEFLFITSKDTPVLYPSPDPVIFPRVSVTVNPVNAIGSIVVSVDQTRETCALFYIKEYISM